MTDRLPLPAMLPDPGLPGARGLLASEGTRALATFLEERRWSLEDARPVQVLYRPERSCVVRYRARTRTPAGVPRVLIMAAEVRRHQAEPPPAPATFEQRHGLADPVGQVGPYRVWVFPYDPALPGLSEAAWGPSVREALRHRSPGPLALSAEPLAYRPRRRAVFRYRLLSRGHGRTMFGKVLRTAKAERWHAVAGRHGGAEHVRLSLPVASLDSRTLLLEPLPGRSLRDLLLRGLSLPSPRRVAGLSRLPEGLPAAPGGIRPTAVRMAEGASALLGRLVPECAPQIERIVQTVRINAAGGRLPLRPVHGDLYEAQVFVAEDFSLGLIDLDDMGPGDPAFDAANFSAHLIALALSVPRAADRLLAYRTLMLEAFAAELGISTGALAWREALAMLLLATGPFRVADPAWPRRVRDRIDLAVRLLGGDREQR